jgi:hypothetical protein
MAHRYARWRETMSFDETLIPYAAALAPEVDRLFIAGHAAARPRARALIQELMPLTLGPMMDLRKLLLSRRGMTLEEAMALERYVVPEQLAGALQERVRDGLLRERNGRYVPTDRGREALLLLTDSQLQAITDLWREAGGALSEAADLAGKAIAGAAGIVAAEEYGAFNAERAGFLPESITPAYLLWSHLATLRYLRADAHALAWRELGLDAAQVGVFTALWKGEPAADHATQDAVTSLIRRGWVAEAEGQLQLSPEGTAHRDLIEWKTNLYATPPLLVLTENERARFMTLLHRLPTG